ncbi:MAG: hypothetical protein H0X64_07665 [Gemmatimonadaceae bacterium]|nr:hypothetical protein [Gemmatimonadaceae bacterium]
MLLEFEQWLLNERVLEALKAIAGIATVVAVLAIGADGGVAESAADVVGMGWLSFIGCVSCLAGAGLIVASGAGAILAALYYPGGAYIAATCVATCVAAVTT